MSESIFNKLKERMGKVPAKKELVVQNKKSSFTESAKKDKIDSILLGINEVNVQKKSVAGKKPLPKKEPFSEKDLIVEESKKITPPVKNIEKKRTVVGGLFSSVDTSNIRKGGSEKKEFFVGDSFSKKQVPVKKQELLLKKEPIQKSKKIDFEKFIDGLEKPKTETKSQESQKKSESAVKESGSKKESKKSEPAKTSRREKNFRRQKKNLSSDYKEPSISSEYFGDKKEPEPEYLKPAETEASIAKELFDNNAKEEKHRKKGESKLLNLIILIVIVVSIIVLFFAWKYFFGG